MKNEGVINKRRLAVSLVFLLAWGSLVFGLSSQNGAQTVQVSGSLADAISRLLFGESSAAYYAAVHNFLRKAAHVALYYVLFFPVLGVMTSLSIKNSAVKYVGSMAIVAAAAFFDEWHKRFIEGRHFSVLDTSLNILGALFAMLTVLLVVFLKRKNRSR